jgi:hypothetical protein
MLRFVLCILLAACASACGSRTELLGGSLAADGGTTLDSGVDAAGVDAMEGTDAGFILPGVDAESCLVCYPGDRECQGNGIATCGMSPNGCTEWLPPVPCPTPEGCASGLAGEDGPERTYCACPDGGIADGGCAIDPATVPAPRAIAPLSTASVTSQTPALHWVLAGGTDGAIVDICMDRACDSIKVSFQAPGTSGTVPETLTTGPYYWRLHGTSQGTTGTPTNAVWEFFVGARSAPVNTSWGTTLDVNGDGFADVVVGASDPVSFDGGAYLYLGGPGGLSPMARSLPPPAMNGGYGESVASAGDLDGDGFADLVVGAPLNEDFVGAAFVYAGGQGGVSATPTTLSGTRPIIQFGYTVAGAGDVNGDGYGDLLVQATGDNSESGLAYLYLGGAGGVTTTATVLSASAVSTVAPAGDVNGDGFADVVVGTYAPESGGSIVGAVDVFVGGAGGLSATPLVLAAPSGLGGTFGSAAGCAGDVNGDGLADVIVGANGASADPLTAFVYLGDTAGLNAKPIVLQTPSPDTGFVEAVNGVGDVNGDGFGDVVVTAWNPFVGSAIRYYVYLGSKSGPSATPIVLATDQSAQHAAVAGAGDVNGDGFDDIVVGTIVTDGASLYFGSASGPAKSPTAIVDMYPDGLSNQSLFGYAVQ